MKGWVRIAHLGCCNFKLGLPCSLLRLVPFDRRWSLAYAGHLDGGGRLGKLLHEGGHLGSREAPDLAQLCGSVSESESLVLGSGPSKLELMK